MPPLQIATSRLDVYADVELYMSPSDMVIVKNLTFDLFTPKPKQFVFYLGCNSDEKFSENPSMHILHTTDIADRTSRTDGWTHGHNHERTT